MEIEEYIERHIDAEPDYLQELQRHTNLYMLYPRMCSGHLQGRVLKMLVTMAKPKRILELGTFSGYSALCLAEGLAADGRLDTVEIEDELEDFLRQNFSRSPYGEKIRLHIGDFEKLVKEDAELLGPFDMVFIDANKRHYCRYYELVKPLVKVGGYIIADNTLWDSHVLEEGRKEDAQTHGIKAFNDMVAADGEVEKVILPLRDGLTIIRKNNNGEKGVI